MSLRGRLPKALREEAMRILENGEAHERVGETIYSVRVRGKFLCSENTEDLREKIERHLRQTHQTT